MFRFFFVFLITLLITNQSYAQRAPQSPIPTKYYELFSDGTYGTPFFILDVGRAGQVAPTPNCDRGCRIAIAILNDDRSIKEEWHHQISCQYGIKRQAHFYHPETKKWELFTLCYSEAEHLERKKVEEGKRVQRELEEQDRYNRSGPWDK